MSDIKPNLNGHYHHEIGKNIFTSFRALSLQNLHVQLPAYAGHEESPEGMYRYDDNGIFVVLIRSTDQQHYLEYVFRRRPLEEGGELGSFSVDIVALTVDGQLIFDTRDLKTIPQSSTRLHALDTELLEHLYQQSIYLLTPAVETEGAAVLRYTAGFTVPKPDDKLEAIFWTGDPLQPWSDDFRLAQFYDTLAAAEAMTALLEAGHAVWGAVPAGAKFAAATLQVREEITTQDILANPET